MELAFKTTMVSFIDGDPLTMRPATVMWLFGLEVGRVVVARCGEGSGSSAGSAATKLAVPRRPRLCVSLPTTARVVMP